MHVLATALIEACHARARHGAPPFAGRCILEIHAAVTAQIPIVAVAMRGKNYDFKQATYMLTFLDTELERLNPGASAVLEKVGRPALERHLASASRSQCMQVLDVAPLGCMPEGYPMLERPLMRSREIARPHRPAGDG